MPRKPLTEAQQLKGTVNAIAALRKKRSGPRWLIPSLEKRRDELQAKLHGDGKRRKSGKSFLHGCGLLSSGSRGSARHVAVIALALVLAVGFLFWPSRPPHEAQAQNAFAVQQGFYNSVLTGNGTLLKTITPSALGSVRIYSVGAYCSPAGTGGQLVVQVMPLTATGLWNSGPFDVGSNLASFYWPTPLQAPPGTPVVIQVGGCNGGGSTNITLEFQYSVN